ncbi:MAG: pantetheine-phosphate adenylyltransferase [Gemmatimonadota bacterium]|nr:MAG: pantetheine-phosphate adenylyltransferase [Gemmatimonadota bacterium]
MGKAIYAGTFDPVTFGHIDIVDRAAEVFDHLIVTTTNNLNKTPFFDLDERIDLLKRVLADKPGIEITPFSGLLVDFARSTGAKVLVRGLRAAADFDYEFEMGLMNRELAPEIETVFFVTRPQYMFVSSKLVREVAHKGGDIGLFVPPAVQNAIISKLAGRGTGV